MSTRDSSTLSEREKVIALEQKVLSLEQQIDWFKRQLFGRKSEKRELEPNPDQPLLNGLVLDTPAARKPETETITYTRAKQRDDNCVTDSGLRFDDSVPKKTIRCSAAEISHAAARSARGHSWVSSTRTSIVSRSKRAIAPLELRNSWHRVPSGSRGAMSANMGSKIMDL